MKLYIRFKIAILVLRSVQIWKKKLTNNDGYFNAKCIWFANASKIIYQNIPKILISISKNTFLYKGCGTFSIILIFDTLYGTDNIKFEPPYIYCLYVSVMAILQKYANLFGMLKDLKYCVRILKDMIIIRINTHLIRYCW